MENETLELLTPPPEEKLQGWLDEFYSKPVKISHRELLRYRDLSLVERLTITDSLPESLIYKVVLPPWDVELDLHQRVLVPSITSSPTLYMAAHFHAPDAPDTPDNVHLQSMQHPGMTVMFFEDLGPRCLKLEASAKLATALGEKLARLHRSYSYRTEELKSANLLQTIAQENYVELTSGICSALSQWGLLNDENLLDIAQLLTKQLSGEPVSLVHGDFYAENLIPRGDDIYIVDWSWFAILGVPLMDLATVTMDHFKNGELLKYRKQIIEAYCFESGRPQKEVEKLLPAAETLSRLLFLYWLVVRRKLGIMGTTVGHIDDLIAEVVSELTIRRGVV